MNGVNGMKPVIAMLWENWQLTRVEAGQRLGLGLVLGAGALFVPSHGATVAFWILIMLHSMIWFSIAKLNGGRFADGYKPGFPLYLLFTRPVSTVVMVAVAIAYDAISCLALYLVSAALLGLAFGQSLPVFSVSLWILTSHVAYACVQWSTRSRAIQWLGSIAFFLPLFLLLKSNVATPPRIEFSLVENAALVFIALVSFGLTIVGVARQRRGDSVALASPKKEISGEYPDWLITLFKFPCPTASAARAQVWFELKSSGLPVLVIGVSVAILILLLCAISTAFGNARFAAIPVALLAVPIVLFGLGGNAFGIRRKQGRTYASAFELTQPYSTAQLASVKVFVRTACVLVALVVIGASLWASSSMVGAWGEFVLNNNRDVAPVFLKVRQKLADDFEGLTVFTPVIASIAVASIVAWQAAREALRTRYLRLLLVVQWLPAAWGLASIALALAHRKGIVSIFLLREFFTASFWISGAAMAITASYLLWSGLAQRALTIRYACGAVAISAAFGAAWLGAMPAASVGILWPVLLLLMLTILAPWSLSRVRHM